MRALRLNVIMVVVLWASNAAFADHYYGITPGDNDPAISSFAGALANGTLSGVLAAGSPQPNEPFVHILIYATAGDIVSVNTNGSDQDTGLAINTDTAFDGIFVGDAPPNTGAELTFLTFDDDSGTGLNSALSFTATYTGAYLASIAEIRGRELNWVINVSGSTGTVPVPEPSGLLLLGLAVGTVAWRRRRR